MEISIGERIASRRKELGITGKQINEATGISTGNLSGIEKGSSLPSATALIGLSKILNCSIDWILTGKNSDFGVFCETAPLSADETELISTYNRLDRRGQHRVHTVIYEEIDRIEKSASKDAI